MGKPAILVVDDEPNIRGALLRWFQIRGFEVHTADDGLEAIALCEQRSFDIITMDLEMPRMGGVDAISGIRRLSATVPILVLTGMLGDKAHVLAAGATKILAKPLPLSELESEVRQILESLAAE